MVVKHFIERRKTMSWHRVFCVAALACLWLGACNAKQPVETAQEAEGETRARTEFTNRIENFFEYEPLRAGKPSRFLIHLTDLSDGAPVEQAEVVLSIRSRSGEAEIAQAKARVGKVTGIYVADVTVARAGDYGIEFRVKNSKLDERLPLKDFKVE